MATSMGKLNRSLRCPEEKPPPGGGISGGKGIGITCKRINVRNRVATNIASSWLLLLSVSGAFLVGYRFRMIPMNPHEANFESTIFLITCRAFLTAVPPTVKFLEPRFSSKHVGSFFHLLFWPDTSTAQLPVDAE